MNNQTARFSITPIVEYTHLCFEVSELVRGTWKSKWEKIATTLTLAEAETMVSHLSSRVWYYDEAGNPLKD